MEVILLQDVKTLGKKGDKVNVSDGYARNMLFPKKLATPVNNKTLNDLKAQKLHEAKEAKEKLDAALEMKEKIEAKKVEVTAKTGEGGKIFGSVSTKGDALWSLFHTKDPKEHEWHYRGLADALRDLHGTFAYKEFEELINQVFG